MILRCALLVLFWPLLVAAAGPASRGNMAAEGDPIFPSKEEYRAPLIAELQSLSGRRAFDCGLVALREHPGPPLACADKANSKGVPFKVATQLQGIDSIVWRAAILTEQGERLLIQYDSNINGDALKIEPHFSRTACKAFTFSTSAGSHIKCVK
jgi:hypothetical protein